MGSLCAKFFGKKRKGRDHLEDHNLENSLLKEVKHIVEDLSGILSER